jgi:ribosomal protein S18 acetylase RimI-like enzyme
MPPVAVRQASEPAAAALLLKWAAAEGWNPGLHDAAAFHAADPNGWWVAETTNGEPVGGLSLVHDEDRRFAFLGLYIVRPDWRGKGVGMRVWQAALAASPAACIGLDGVPAQQANYSRSGFRLAFRSQRFRFDQTALAGVDTAGLIDLAHVPATAVRTLDRAVAYPGRRDAFLARWSAPSDGAGLAIVSDGAPTGYGVIRRCSAGHKIGPLVAARPDDALRLLAGLVAAAAAEECFLDVPHVNTAALALVERAGFQPVFETARMYRGAEPPSLDLDRLWGVTTFELG